VYLSINGNINLNKLNNPKINQGWLKIYTQHTILTFILLFIILFGIISFKYSARYSFEYFSDYRKIIEWFWYLAVPSLIANIKPLSFNKDKT